MESYNSLIKNLNKSLTNLGFDKNKDNLYIKECNNFGIINIQKSKTSSITETIFSINYGICSTVLAKYLWGDFTLPDITMCQWKTRIQQTNYKKEWWILHKTINPITLEQVILEQITNLVIPTINDLLCDESLIEAWLKGNSKGITVYERYRYLILLMKKYSKYNVDDTLKKFIDEQGSSVRSESLCNDIREELKTARL